MCFKIFLKKFFSNEFVSFEQSQLGFRKKILRILQFFWNILIILYMIISYASMEMNLFYYVGLPILLIMNNLFISTLNCNKNMSSYSRIFFFSQLIYQTVGLELALSKANSFSTSRALLMGMQVGLIHMIGSLNLCSSLLRFASSIIFFIQLTLRLALSEIGNLYFSLFFILMLELLINLIYYHFEMLNFSVWSSYMKSNMGLLHFQKLIDIFPGEIVIINRKSLDEDKPLYLNQEAELLRNVLFQRRNNNLIAFLEAFLIEEVRNVERDNEQFDNNKQTITLKAFVQERLSESMQVGEFQKVISELDSFKWEIKYGLIEWNTEGALILIFNDISKSEKISKLENIDKNKDRILATVSHELKTPLNAVVGMIDVSLEETPNHCESVKNYLKVAKESAKVLSMMIDNVLDMELIRKGNLLMDFKVSLLTEILDNVVPITRVLARKKNLDFIIENKCPKNTTVIVDPSRFQQILMNLLDNAVKFTTQGFIKLSVKLQKATNLALEKNVQGRRRELPDILSFNNTLLEKEMLFNNCYSDNVSNQNILEKDEDEEFQHIKFTVEDSGIGVSEEKKKCLFKVFGKEETNLTVRGMGLGLAISQSLALKMGSTGIYLESKRDKGSKFFFNIKASVNNSSPFEIPSEEVGNLKFHLFPNRSLCNSEMPCHESKPPIERTKILIVDDDEVNHQVISLYLRTLKNFITMDKAYNGRDAVAIVHKKAENNEYYDLILMDCDMPIMNGLEATRALKESARLGEIRDMKIVALTANASLSNKECCIGCGMEEVWNKPISKSEFLNKLRLILPNRWKDEETLI